MTSPAEADVTIAEMLRRIAEGRASLDALFASAPATSPGAWSVKDHMAHIAVWERSALALLRGEPRHAHIGLSATESSSLDTDGINERAHAIYRDQSPAEVRAFYDETHEALVDHLASMSDADLMLPYSHFQPDDPPYNARPVWPWIAGNTFGHYEEHAAIVRAASH